MKACGASRHHCHWPRATPASSKSGLRPIWSGLKSLQRCPHCIQLKSCTADHTAIVCTGHSALGCTAVVAPGLQAVRWGSTEGGWGRQRQEGSLHVAFAVNSLKGGSTLAEAGLAQAPALPYVWPHALKPHLPSLCSEPAGLTKEDRGSAQLQPPFLELEGSQRK